MPAVAEDEIVVASTVEGVWAEYDLAERELWDTYQVAPTYLQGRIYLRGERWLRRQTDRRVQAIRYG
jgi:hypothetical protein